MGTPNSLETELKDISMFVLSSDYEGLPNALIEAMVMGIPVGDEGKLAEAMIYYLEHPKKAHAMGMKGQEILKQVAPKKVTEAWENYINQILHKK